MPLSGPLEVNTTLKRTLILNQSGQSEYSFIANINTGRQITLDKVNTTLKEIVNTVDSAGNVIIYSLYTCKTFATR